MSAFVLLRAAGHRLALVAARVVRFDRGDEGQLLPGEPEEADWVVALRDGQLWRTQQRPVLADFPEVKALPPMLADWGANLGVEGCISSTDGLVLVVSPEFARGTSS